MATPRKRPTKKKFRTAKEAARLRKTGWRCATCWEWHPSIAARDACDHARIGGC